MAPIVILIRHAEGLHNVKNRSHLHDPVLTPKGELQCADLQRRLRTALYPWLRAAEGDAAHDILIVTSPMVRTIQTAQLSLQWLLDFGVRMMPLAEWQENSSLPSDTGSTLTTLRTTFPTVDFSTVDPRYPGKTGPFAFTRTAVLARGAAAREWLRQRPEKVVIVVSHSAFMRTALTRRYFANADFRIYRFREDGMSDGKGAEWEEGGETEGRGGMGWSKMGRAEIWSDDFPVDRSENVVEKGVL